ncbi:MAG TPA: TetR/AcrR family transcriptional regulator [Actinomycetota bacterium]|nr:TetR/AcrR family transcriptional regulator [Actinomycetota bacterium]
MSSPEHPPHRTAGQRAGLSREAVLGAARRVADDQGVDHLTMRRLAAELGVTPNALYTYLPDKEALLDALVDDLLGGIETGDPAEGDWRDGLARVMDASRRLLLAHPRLVPVFLARPGLGPNAARLGELSFQLLRRGGLEGDRAVEAFRVLLAYSLGFAAFQAPRLEADDGARAETAQGVFAGLPEDRFPEMRRLAGPLAGPTTGRHFHTGLRWLLDGVSATAPQEG